jgi:hypothetical protein
MLIYLIKFIIDKKLVEFTMECVREASKLPKEDRKKYVIDSVFNKFDNISSSSDVNLVLELCLKYLKVKESV